MIIFSVNKGIDGIISALYYSFINKKKADKIVVSGEFFQGEINSDIISIGNIENSQKERVVKALKNYGGGEIIKYLNVVLLSGNPNSYSIAYNYGYKTLLMRKNIWGRLADKEVREFVYEFNAVLRERHRIGGFLRFAETENGVLYASYAPDNDITTLIAPHFLSRYKGIPFVIHDIKRNSIAVSDGNSIKYGNTDRTATISFSEDEKKFLSLFKEYYKCINVSERLNLKQQENYMPKKYRKFMPETYKDN